MDPQKLITDSQAFGSSASGEMISSLWRTAMKRRGDAAYVPIDICAVRGEDTLLLIFSQPVAIKSTQVEISATCLRSMRLLPSIVFRCYFYSSPGRLETKIRGLASRSIRER